MDLIDMLRNADAPRIVERGMIERREELSCFTAQASVIKFDSCINSVNSWVLANDCTTETNPASELSCNCHFMTDFYDCVQSHCPNYAEATVTDELFASVKDLVTVCRETTSVVSPEPTALEGDDTAIATETTASQIDDASSRSTGQAPTPTPTAADSAGPVPAGENDSGSSSLALPGGNIQLAVLLGAFAVLLGGMA